MGRSVNWERLAVTVEDFTRDDLIGFPTRRNTSKAWGRRCQDYTDHYGDRCVEVDAITPGEIRQRLRDAIEIHIDQAAWEQLRGIEALEKESIEKTLALTAASGGQQ